MTVTPGISRNARERLADPGYGRALAAMVRRRVPAGDVDDITQTVLCDALDAPRLPTDPVELRRFLCILARNKIADFYRRARRDEPSDAMETATCEPAPVDARVLLGRVVEGTSARDRETLGWLMREHDGEQLAEIADSAGLPRATVRQRVSRLRRALRARWAHALALLLLAGSCGVVVERYGRQTAVAITADPGPDRGAFLLGLAQGSWRIDEASDLQGANVDPRVAELRIHGRQVEVVAPLRIATFTIASTSIVGESTYALELRDESGKVQRATVVVSDSTMILTLRDGRVQGRGRLTRR